VITNLQVVDTIKLLSVMASGSKNTHCYFANRAHLQSVKSF